MRISPHSNGELLKDMLSSFLKTRDALTWLSGIELALDKNRDNETVTDDIVPQSR
jgi:hypothetical protein